MVTLHEIHKFYGKQDVLRNASLRVGPGERIGLVGPNGAGKSTILGLILGQVEPDSGSVFKSKSLRMGYLPQDLIQLSGQTVLELAMDTGDRLNEVEEELDQIHQDLSQKQKPQKLEDLLARQGQLQTIFECLGGYDLQARAEKTLSGLGFKPEQVNQDVSKLSGGWLMRAALARILLSAPDLILLDEPTNHLDLESMLWLENQLSQSPASLLLVSHDRVFLDKVVNRILEVDGGELYTYGGNYSDYITQREARIKAQWAAYEAQQDKKRDMQNFIDRNRSNAARAGQVQGRIKAMEKLEALRPPEAQEQLSLELPPAERSAKMVVELNNVDLSYGDKKVYQNLSFQVQRGDRLALLGRNGEGKSTLLKLLAGLNRPQAGRRLVGGRVKMGVFSQHALEDLNPENDVISELSGVAGLMAISRLRSVLGSFLFKGDEVFKKVRVLSGGERSRLVLAKLFMQGPNFLLLDEPTNHLDIRGRQVLETALKKFEGSIVLVSHERHLINVVANKVCFVSGGRVDTFPGDYDDFHRLWKKRLKPAGQDERDNGNSQGKSRPADTGSDGGGGGKKSAAQKRAEAKERQALYKKLKPLKDEFEKVEAQVEKATEKLDELTAILVDPEVYADSERFQKLSQQHARTKDKLDTLSDRWEELALKLEEAQA
jgi:ATP-binding cassette subfamily F protein 3